MIKINIQIGGHPHKDDEIDNPEFYYQAMDIINQHRIKSEQSIIETNKPKQKDEPNIWIYVIAVIIVCLLCVR